MGRAILQPTSRLLNHNEMFYAPGDRGLVRDLFRAIGCRVLDPQEEDGPSDLGPAANPYLIVFIEPTSTDLFDNVLYASEVEPDQWAFEQALRKQIAADGALRASHEKFEACFARYPQGMQHFGLAMTEAQIEAAFERIRSNPAFENRVTLRGPFRPEGPGSVDARVIQGFVRTDIVSTGLLLGKQQIELQARLD